MVNSFTTLKSQSPGLSYHVIVAAVRSFHLLTATASIQGNGQAQKAGLVLSRLSLKHLPRSRDHLACVPTDAVESAESWRN